MRAPDCGTCHGAGNVDVLRCPRKLLRESNAGEVEAVNYFVVNFNPHGLLPVSGGYQEQPATFAEGMEFLALVHAEHQADQVKKLENRTAKRNRGKR